MNMTAKTILTPKEKEVQMLYARGNCDTAQHESLKDPRLALPDTEGRGLITPSRSHFLLPGPLNP